MFFITKNCGLEIKDLDLAKNTVTGYFASFNTLDSDGDVITKGAFSKSIQENGPKSNSPRIAHLLQHRPHDTIGKLLELEEDGVGLRFVSKLSESTKGRDTLIQYQEGILQEHSVGFNTIKSNRDHKEHNEITEARLWEGSTVTWGANENTPVINIKGLSKVDALDKINKRMAKLQSLITKGNGLTDEAIIGLSIEIEQIKAAYNTLLTEPNESLNPKPQFTAEDLKNHILTNLN